MNFWSRVKVWASTLAAPDRWLSEAFGAQTSAAGKVVTPATAMRASAVYGCVSVLSQDIGTIPLELYKRKSDGSVVPAVDHPLYYLLRYAPNPEMTSVELRENGVMHLCLRGNAYFEIVRSGGSVQEINPLFPDRVRMLRTKSGDLAYEYTDDNGQQSTLRSDQVWRVIGLSSNGLVGMTPIALAREAIGLYLATEEHGAKLFSNGAQVPFALEHPATLKKDQRENIENSFRNRFSGSANAFKVPVLEGGMKIAKIGLTAEDSQFIEARKFQIEEICRIFRVPPHMIQHLDRATFNNIEHLSLNYVMHTLMPWLTRFEQTISRDLLLPSERKKYFARFDVTEMLRGDNNSRANFYASGIANGWMNRNEARRRENMNPVEGLDEFLQPLNMQTPQEGQPEPDSQKG